MPPADGVADLVRVVFGSSGQVTFQTELVVRFDYGSTVPWVTRMADNTIEAIAGPERLVLRTPATLHGEDLKTVGEFVVGAGQSVPFCPVLWTLICKSTRADRSPRGIGAHGSILAQMGAIVVQKLGHGRTPSSGRSSH